jgi:hypothetical protein
MSFAPLGNSFSHLVVTTLEKNVHHALRFERMRAMSDPNQFPPTPPPSWGAQQPGYGYGQQMMPTSHPQGTTILVLGILSLVVCSPLGIAAWVMGNKAQAEMAAQPGVNFTNAGQIKAGKICGIIGVAFLVLSVLLVIVALSAGSSSS